MIGQIRSSVKNIKQSAYKMNEKIRISNKQTEEMYKKYSESDSLINKTTKVLGELFSANTNYWCYLCIFIFIVFFFLYKIGH